MWCAHNWTAVLRGDQGATQLMLFGGDAARGSPLAIADVVRDYAPQPLAGFPHFATLVAFGATHFGVVTRDGRLFTGGVGEHGELARAQLLDAPHGTPRCPEDRVCAPQRVQPLAEVRIPDPGHLFERVSCGPRTTLAVLVGRLGVRTAWGSGSRLGSALRQLDISPLTPDGRTSSTENVLVAAGHTAYVAVGCVVGEMDSCG